MREQPDYCPDDLAEYLDNDRPCPRCGATVSGNDPVGGACQARFNGPEPKPGFRIILTDKTTGKPI